MVELIVSEKYETMKNLHDYSVEEFLALYEMIVVKNIKQRLAMKALNDNRK